MPDNAEIVIQVEGDVTVLSLGPQYKNLDEPKIDRVRRELLAAIDAADPPRLVLDLSNTDFFGSAFIEVLFRSWHRLKRVEGGVFAICGLTTYCREILEVTNLARLWPIYATRDEAVAALSKTED